MKKYKLAFIISHPIQYYAPFFQLLNAHPDVDLTVYFCFKGSMEKFADPEFGIEIKWDRLPLDNYKWKILPNWSPFPGISFFGLINPGIISELKAQKYDAIIVHGYNLLSHWLAFLGAWISKTPIILKGEADLLNLNNLSFLKKNIKKIILKNLFKRVAAFLYSYSLNKDFFKFYGVPEEKLFFYPCAVNNDFFGLQVKQSKSKKELLKQKLGIQNNIPTILFVGKFISRKRVFDLLKATLALKGKIKFNVLLVGDGIQKNEILEFIKKNNLTNVCVFGFKNQSELPEFYSVSDLFVLPSEYDPSPKALNEAMNFSLPIITTDKVGTAKVGNDPTMLPLVIDGENGFTYPVGDIKILSALLEKLLTDNNLRQEMGQNALKTVNKWSFDYDVLGVIKTLEYIKSKYE